MLASGTNPGFVLLVAGVMAALIRPTALRGVVLIGAPVLALLMVLYGPGWGVDAARTDLLGLQLSLYRIDSLSFVFGLAFVVATGLIGIYSLHRREPLEDGAALIYAGAGLAAVFSGDLLSFVLWMELTTLASTAILLSRRTAAANRAALRYFAMHMISGLLLICGVAVIAMDRGTIEFVQLGPMRDGLLVGILDPSEPGGALFLAGLGIKAAFPIVHAWLKDAYPEASETGSVALSVFTTKLAVYALVRCFAGFEPLIWVGAIMTVFPVFFAVVENDLRRVLAYSLNNQVGFMVAAVGVGGELGVNGAALHAFTHIIYKSLLFMSMGAVLLRTGTTKASELGGLHRTMPFTSIFCLIGAASISAFPLFSGFVSKSLIMTSVEYAPGVYIAWLGMMFASAGVLEHSGIKIPYFSFFSHDSGKRPEEAPFNMLLAMGAASAFCIGIGVAPVWLYELAPYREAALEYLGVDLFSAKHVLHQVQLLGFAIFAFLLLKRMHLYPPERPGVILDADWLCRDLGPASWRGIGSFWERASARRARVSEAVDRWRDWLVSQCGPSGWIARRASVSAGAIWTVIILGATLAVIYGAVR
ncbi:Na(+)/H(+) antiporter subunit D [bacterium]|nr:Na(+)/H(+) antiporter subunit D [bacterium]